MQTEPISKITNETKDKALHNIFFSQNVTTEKKNDWIKIISVIKLIDKHLSNRVC